MRRMFTLFGTLAVIAATATCAGAEEPGRVLNGYHFLPSNIVRLPFAISYYANSTGAGLALDVKTPFVEVAGDTLGTLEGDVAYLAMGFSFQHRFGSWFAVNLGFGGGARLGIDEQSVLAEGVTGAFAMQAGVMARILQTDSVILTGAVDFYDNSVVGVDTYSFALSLVEDGLVPASDELVESGRLRNGRVALLSGWAPFEWLGLNGFLEVGRGAVSLDETKTGVGGGLMVGVDLERLKVLPFGILFQFHDEAFATNGKDLNHRAKTMGFGLYYSAWEDFTIGFEGSMNKYSRLDGDGDYRSVLGSFNLCYWP